MIRKQMEGETIRVCWRISGFHCKKILSSENSQMLEDKVMNGKWNVPLNCA